MKIMTRPVFVALVAVCLIGAIMPAAMGASSSNGSNAINSSPARIEIIDERAHVTADEEDNIVLFAHVYDAQGNPALDGTQVNFTIGNEVVNSYNGGYNWSFDDGSLTAPPYSSTFYNFTEGGIAIASYGWVPEGKGGNNSTIWAYVNGTDIHSTVKIYSAAPSASWMGRVVDLYGAGVGGIPVTLHVMGYQNNGAPYEIYNMTRITGVRSASAGNFSFDYIVLQGAGYGYVDAKVELANNTTVYGKSDNHSMNRTMMQPIGLIVLKTSPRILVTVSASTMTPSTTAKPTPGFESTLVLAGLMGAAYIASRNEK